MNPLLTHNNTNRVIIKYFVSILLGLVSYEICILNFNSIDPVVSEIKWLCEDRTDRQIYEKEKHPIWRIESRYRILTTRVQLVTSFSYSTNFDAVLKNFLQMYSRRFIQTKHSNNLCSKFHNLWWSYKKTNNKQAVFKQCSELVSF